MTRNVTQAKRPFTTLKLFLLIVVILAAFWLRLHNIDAFSFWTDEGLTPLRSGYSIAQILSNRIIIQQGVTNDTHPAFFFLIIHFTRRLFGETDFAYRFPSALAGVLLVPVMFQFGRRLRDTWLGYAAALLTAVNPLYLWYANEARMYTIYVLLMTVASYLLWRALEVSRQPSAVSRQSSAVTDNRPLTTDYGLPTTDHRLPITKYLPLYIFCAGLGLYTHYTAVFLIAAQSLFWMWILWQHGQKRLIVGTAVIGLLIAVPLVPYTIPRLFQGAEANFFYVPPTVVLQDVVRFFGLGNLVDFKQPFIQLLTIGFACLLLLGILIVDSRLKRNFLLTYLFAVVIGVILGSLIKPIYQGARHILAGSPAFILLVSWAVVWLWSLVCSPKSEVRSPKSEVRGPWSVVRSRLTAHGSRLTAYRLPLTVFALIATAVPLTSAAIAVNNLYTNPRYAKDSLRDAIRFVEQSAGDNDVIVYNNAILLPLHEHYQQRPDVAVTASPIYPTLSSQTAAAQLESLAAAYTRIWFITDPPADKRDRDKLVEKWLNTNSTLIEDYPFPAKDTRLSAIVFDTGEQIVAELPQTAVSLHHQWPNTPELQGVRIAAAEPIDTPTFWIDLYWQGEQPSNTWLRFSLRGPDGNEWARTAQSLITQRGSAANWPENNLIRYSYPIRLPLGTPPGTYNLAMQPFAKNGGALGDFQILTQITVADSGKWLDVVKRPYADYQSIRFQNGLSLKGVELADSDVRPGHALPISIYWQAAAENIDLQNAHYTLTVRQPDGAVLNQSEGTPGPPWLTDWPAGAPIRKPEGLYFPPDTEPGRYALEWQLFSGDDVVPGRPFFRPWNTSTVSLGEVNVVPWPLETALPQDGTVLHAQFGEAIQLYGYTLTETADSLQLILTWQAQSAPDKNYVVFVHLVDEAGEIVRQRDVIPVDGLRPTAGWRTGEVLTDSHTIALPENLPGGTYALRVGLYEPDAFIRLPITYQGALQANDQLELDIITRP